MLFSALAILASQALVVSAKPALTARQSGARAYASNQALTLRLSEIDAPVSGPGNPGSDTWNLSINDTPSGYKQTVKGFGGTVTDATVTVINALPADQRSQLLRELLTPDGAHFSFLRHTIGASDLSAPPAYTYDDNNGQPDPNMDGFNLGDRGVDMAEMLAEMKGINPDALILGSAWSAPGWMKESRVGFDQK
jgi:glucan endo-1,6-beta-glucosidase